MSLEKDEPSLMCKTTYVGIDVGLKGGITILNSLFTETYSFPLIIEEDSKGKKRSRLDVFELLSMLETIIPCNSIVALEQQASRSKQGVVSVFSLGRQYGILECLMTYLSGQEPFFVPPRRWKDYYGDDLNTDEIKELRIKKKNCKDKKEKGRIDYQLKKKMKQESVNLANDILLQNYAFIEDNGEIQSPSFFSKNEDGMAESFLIACFAMETL